MVLGGTMCFQIVLDISRWLEMIPDVPRWAHGVIIRGICFKSVGVCFISVLPGSWFFHPGWFQMAQCGSRLPQMAQISPDRSKWSHGVITWESCLTSAGSRCSVLPDLLQTAVRLSVYPCVCVYGGISSRAFTYVIMLKICFSSGEAACI